MLNIIRNWLNQRIIQRSTITPAQWSQAFTSLPLLKVLLPDEAKKLKQLTILFLHRKVFESAHGLEITDAMRLIIALQACLPILNLDINTYDGWVSVIVYPAGFSPEQVYRDEYGVEHIVTAGLAGQAWLRGPVLLAWDETQHAGIIDGENLVIHEFAHKLDMQTGSANGFPPLHKGMDTALWNQAFSAGFKDFRHRCHQGLHSVINCYAATSPAEFFAVLSEVFFERPSVLVKDYPLIYKQLKQYYRQDPLLRF